MIERITPADVRVASARPEAVDELLLPEEQVLVARASPKRRREFAAGRHCARVALASLGHDPVPVGMGPKREPLWPSGVVGSITHCATYAAAAVARAERVASVGIDVEVDEPLPNGVLERVALPAERAFVARHLGDGVPWDRLLFSAKEAVYKAWFPLAHRWLGYHDARIDVDPATETFDVELLVPVPDDASSALRHLRGRYVRNRGHVACAVVLRRDHAPSDPAEAAAW